MAVDGKWNITIKTPMGDQNATLTLKQDGSARPVRLRLRTAKSTATR